MNDMMNKSPMGMMLSDEELDSVTGGRSVSFDNVYVNFCHTCKVWFLSTSPLKKIRHKSCKERMLPNAIPRSELDTRTAGYTRITENDVEPDTRG